LPHEGVCETIAFGRVAKGDYNRNGGELTPMITANFQGQTSDAQAAGGWYVKNGKAEVGPVPTDLLLRGIEYGRVPGDSMVRQESWTSWRRLSQIRETCLAVGDPRDVAPELPSPAELIRRARDPGEALLLGLHLSIRTSRADVGLVHRVRKPCSGLMTASFHGWALQRQLGEVLKSHDPAVEHARAAGVLLSGPNDSDAARSIAARLNCGPFVLRGVAMIPVRCAGRLDAMIELGRFDHPFRAVDAASLRGIANALVRRSA
jgi:hypothetical protein